MMHTALLFAQTPTRTTFEWGRIQSETDWIAPLVVAGLLLLFVGFMYRRDTVEHGRVLRAVLTLLRMTAFVGLLLVYLQPQWRNEVDVVHPSRVLMLFDVSRSMDRQDSSDESPGSADASEGRRRADEVAAALAGSDLVERLRETHDVVLARFGESMQTFRTLPKRGDSVAGQPPIRPVSDADQAAEDAPVAWPAELAPRANETRLGQAIGELVNEERTKPISGLVVFTDGQQNAGPAAAGAIETARQAGIAVYPVGIGSDRQPVNVQISDFLVPTRAFPGDSYKVKGIVQGYGLDGEAVTVELLSRTGDARTGPQAGGAGTLEGRETVVLGGEGEMVPVEFELTPTEAGRRTLQIQVRGVENESDPTDNVREADVEIVDRKTHVLLFAGASSREYRFVRNQLWRDRSTIVDVLLQTGHDGISQDAAKILDDFPATREELYDYDCIVAFDPDWRELDDVQIDLLEGWVGDQAGGLIVIAGPVHTDSWVQNDRMTKIRALYPVQFQRRFALLDNAHFGSEEPWPIELTREGREAEFLWLDETATASQTAWDSFPGVYGHYDVEREKPGARVYGRYSDPRSAEGGQLPVYFADQFYGSGRVFYLGSGEMWRLRAVDEAYFERFYTKLIRHVSQGRLLRGSSRGFVLAEESRYVAGNTVNVRAQLTNAQLEPLELAGVALNVILPDGALQSVTLKRDETRQGSYQGQFTARQEGTYRLELPVPESNEEILTNRIQVRMPDLENEDLRRNDPLLSEVAEKTGGVYFVGVDEAISGGHGRTPLVDLLPDMQRTVTLSAAPERLWDNRWVMFVLCGVLCVEWLIRRLAKLA